MLEGCCWAIHFSPSTLPCRCEHFDILDVRDLIPFFKPLSDVEYSFSFPCLRCPRPNVHLVLLPHPSSEHAAVHAHARNAAPVSLARARPLACRARVSAVHVSVVRERPHDGSAAFSQQRVGCARARCRNAQSAAQCGRVARPSSAQLCGS